MHRNTVWFLCCNTNYHSNDSLCEWNPFEIASNLRTKCNTYSLNDWDCRVFFKIRPHFSVSGATLNSHYILCHRMISMLWFSALVSLVKDALFPLVCMLKLNYLSIWMHWNQNGVLFFYHRPFMCNWSAEIGKCVFLPKRTYQPTLI